MLLKGYCKISVLFRLIQSFKILDLTMAIVEKVNIAATKVIMMKCVFVQCKHAVSAQLDVLNLLVSPNSLTFWLYRFFSTFFHFLWQKKIFFCQKRIIRFRLKAHPFHVLTCPSADCYQLTTWDTIHKLHFLRNLRMEEISLSVCNWQAFPF